MLQSFKFGRVKETSIHHFSGTSDSGYGQASYLHVSKTGTIPRMKLVAATLSVKISALYRTNFNSIMLKKHF